jgi:hypothetical protein
LKGRIPAIRTYLYYDVEKTPDARWLGVVQQSDYAARWQAAGAAA